MSGRLRLDVLSRHCGAPLGVRLRQCRTGRPTRRSNAAGKNSVKRFSSRMNSYRSVKFSRVHVAEVARIKRQSREAGLFFVPGQRAQPAGVPFLVPGARPGCFVDRLGMIIPNECLPVSRALISSLAERDIREHQEHTRNEQELSSHR